MSQTLTLDGKAAGATTAVGFSYPFPLWFSLAGGVRSVGRTEKGQLTARNLD